MKTIVNIQTGTVLQALRNAKPLTAVGRTAVENFRSWMVKNTLGAIALENAITSLNNNYDPGLENLVSVLKGLLPESRRKVAFAYESLQMQQAGTIFSASPAAIEALVGLYNDNAAKIVYKINDGALDAYKTNPVIASLIQWAKAAAMSQEPAAATATLINSGIANVKFSLVPVLNLASVDDNMLVAIDRFAYLLAKSGKLTYVPDITTITELPNEVKALMYCLGAMHTSTTEANILLFNDEIVDTIRKAIPIRRIGINLLGGIDSMVVINDDMMSVDKAKALLAATKDDMIAAMLTGQSMPETLQIVNTAFDIFERYRGIVNSNIYANKFTADDTIIYVLETGNRIAVSTVMNGAVIDVTSYNTMFDAISSEIFITNPALYDIVSKTFADELKSDAKKMSVRKQIAMKLSEERKEYESLLERIDRELDNLEQTSDANPEKADALAAVKTKVAEKIALVAEELTKLSKA